MVQSASSSNTQCPSACRYFSSACVAELMLGSRPSAVPSCVVAAECISPVIPWLCRSGLTESLNSHRPRSSLVLGEDEIGGAVSRPYRTFDGCRQPRISPVAGKKQVFEGRRGARPQRVLFRCSRKSGAALAHNLPGRHFGGNAGRLADIPP